MWAALRASDQLHLSSKATAVSVATALCSGGDAALGGGHLQDSLLSYMNLHGHIT